MTKASHLWALGFDDMGRANQFLEELRKLGDQEALLLLDSAVAVRFPDGSLTLDGEPFVVAEDLRGHSFRQLFGRPGLGRAAADRCGSRRTAEKHLPRRPRRRSASVRTS